MNLNALINILLARKVSIIATTAAAIIAAITVSLLTPKTYTAATDLLVDSRGLDPISGQAQPLQSTGAYLSTQADIIRSHNVATKVMTEVQLNANPIVIEDAKLTGDAETDKRRILGFLAQGLIVTPKRESSLLTIAFQSKDPVLAAQLANAFAQAYMVTNLELRIEPAKQTTQWFNQQLEGLRTDLVDKQNALSNYQEKHNIIVSSDRLDLESAKLEELSSMLIAVQSERLTSQSRSDQIENTKRGQVETRALDNPQVQKLATDMAQAQARLNELTTQVGENHPQYRQALSEVDSLKKQMNRQIELISTGLKSSIELSQAREDQLKAELAHQKELVLQLSRNRNEITLLRQEVDNAQAAYDAALARTAESRLESQIAATDVAVLNSAMTPGRPTSPKPMLTTLLATIIGLLLGTAIALGREWFDQRIRSAQDLEQGLGLAVLAQIPAGISAVYKGDQGMNDLAQVLSNSDSMLAASTRMGPMLVAKGKINPKDLSMILAAQKKHGLRFGEAALKLGLIKDEDIKAILAEQFAYTQTPAASSKLDRRLSALFQPDSAQAEALRSLRSELQLRYFNPQPHRALTLVSAEDAAGSALTAANLAVSFAQLGLRTLLIDSNLRHPQLNTLFDLPEHAPGLSDWIAERTSVAPTVIDAVRCLSVLPAGTRAPNPQELLASKHFQARIEALTLRFDITLISTAPLDSNRDAQLVAAQTGAALLLARTHVTSTKALAAITNRLRELGVRLVGASLQG